MIRRDFLLSGTHFILRLHYELLKILHNSFSYHLSEFTRNSISNLCVDFPLVSTKNIIIGETLYSCSFFNRYSSQPLRSFLKLRNNRTCNQFLVIIYHPIRISISIQILLVNKGSFVSSHRCWKSIGIPVNINRSALNVKVHSRIRGFTHNGVCRKGDFGSTSVRISICSCPTERL